MDRFCNRKLLFEAFGQTTAEAFALPDSDQLHLKSQHLKALESAEARLSAPEIS